jgi:hypothetical protein
LSSSLLSRRLSVAVVIAGLWPSVAAAQNPNVPPQEPPPSSSPTDAAPSFPQGGVAQPSPPPSVRESLINGPPAADDALRGDVERLREQVRELGLIVENAHPPPQPAPVVEKPTTLRPRPLGYQAFWPWVIPPEGISLGAYVQSQYEAHQDSQDQLQQGGAVLNKNRFLIRRARASLLGEWEYAAIAVEIDANTTNGPQVDLRKAEASLQYRPDRTKPPIVMATLGQFDTPFGYELVESPRTRWFMERSQTSLAFWPGEPDLGLRLAGALEFFRWTIAAVNGEPLGEKSAYVLQDPNSAKDVVFRFGFDATPREDLQVAGGVSALRGKGFHPGTDATKSSLQWQDLDNNGLVGNAELTAIPGNVATPSQNFDRWAAGADLRLNYRSPLGVTKVYGEFVLGSNMDRGLYVADPIVTLVDQRELGFYVGASQEVGPYGIVGFRYDYYDPNSNAVDSRAGRNIPTSEVVKTYSPLIGVALPDRARLLFQYDIVRNALARTAEGVPTDLKSNVWTVRLQVQL